MPTVTIGGNTADTYSGCDDLMLKENDPTTNRGSDWLEVTKYTSGDWTTGLIKFTGLSNIPSSSIITAVSLFLYQYGTSGADGSYVIAAKPLLRDWVEAQATWTVYSTGNSWNSGGAFGNGSDRTNTVGLVSAGLSAANGYKELVGNSDGIATVQSIVNAGANYGWMLERTDASNDFAFRQFESTETGNDGNRPYLSVTYTEGTPQFFQYAWPHQLHARR